MKNKVYYFVDASVLISVDDTSRNFFPKSRNVLNESICVCILCNKNWYWTGSTGRPICDNKGIGGWPGYELESITVWGVGIKRRKLLCVDV